MDRRLRNWEVVLVVAVLCLLTAGAWLSREQGELAERLIRFHVVAHSDRAEDQELKLAVRDRVLEQARAIYPPDATLEEVYAALEAHLDLLEAAGRAVVEEEGYAYPVSARLEQCWFPTKEYNGFALPAGNYTALRVTIGAGEGQNWWCVAFPPLCLGAASQTVEAAAQAGLFSEDQTALVTEESGGYMLKFKCMELLGNLRGLLR